VYSYTADMVVGDNNHACFFKQNVLNIYSIYTNSVILIYCLLFVLIIKFST